MCEQASISGKRTNHSLRAFRITTMFQADLPEKVIQDRSGHRSIDGLRKYERISEEQQASACKICQEVLQERHIPQKHSE